MVLLVVIALAMLSLSTIAIRSTGHEEAQAEAHANARLALMLALGELQQSMGPDQNISATAGILDANPDSEELDAVKHPYLTGVWNARKEDLSKLPDYDREAAFRSWLVSHGDRETIQKIDFGRAGSFDFPVLLVDPNTTGNRNLTVHAGKVDMNRGGYAWWVGDENTKAAMAPKDLLDRESGPSVAAVLARSATPGAHGIRGVDDFEDMETNSETSDRLVTRETLELLGDIDTNVSKYFHDITPYSSSVLANVSQGTLRKDLNLFLERKDIDWLAGWGKQGQRGRKPTAPLGPNSRLALSEPNEYDVLSWKQLHHWYNMHRRQVGTGNNYPLLAMNSGSKNMNPVDNPAWNSGVMSVTPVLVRCQMLISYGTKKVSDNQYDVYFYAYPVLTVWNPYNVGMQLDEYSVFIHTLPLIHQIWVNDRYKLRYRWQFPGGNMIMRLGGNTGEGITLAPGESKVLNYYRIPPNPIGWAKNWANHDMIAAKRPWSSPNHVGHPHYLGRITGSSNQDIGNQRIKIKTTAAEWDAKGTSYAAQQFQTTFGFRCEAKAEHLRGSLPWQIQMFTSQVAWRREKGNPVSDQISLNNFPSRRLDEVEDAPTPFIYLDVRLKTLDEVKLPNKTWLHNLPYHPYAAATSTQKHSTKGVDRATTFYAHPYTYSFEQKSAVEGLFQNTPFFGSSNTPSGQSNIIACGIPMAPLTSLAQLQNLPEYPIEGLNWSGYYMQNNAIGNSFASPGLRPTVIKEKSFPFYLGQYFPWAGGDIAGRLYSDKTAFNADGYEVQDAPVAVIDRSYAANTLLFDDYYFSSLAAQEGVVISKNGKAKTLVQVADDFFVHKRPLPNAFYTPYEGNAPTPEDIVDSLIDERGEPRPDAYRKISAHLMVNGGFNINSTSEAAWTMMLASSLLNHRTVMKDGKLVLEKADNYVVSRYSLPNGIAAGNAGDTASEARRWMGYRELTITEIRELAKAIVKQVKLRGPFRSLGEFVNRRRTSGDTQMALYGALQAALEDEDVSINKNYSNDEITAAEIGDANYKFKEAAMGPRYQGTPAYISQADILMPLAPVINARSDTFLIRSYGESKASNGTVLAKAWCEAVVQRTPDYLDPDDSAEIASDDLTSLMNRSFGRRFTIKSFRWLTNDEISES